MPATKPTATEQRPERSGFFFIVHKSLLKTIQVEETVDFYNEFLKAHPNCDNFAEEFVAVRLSKEMMESQKKIICPASYRWEEKKPDEVGREIPQNYVWFLKQVKQLKLIGWMDWMANVGVNVDTGEVLGYMGQLYAEYPAIPQWLYTPNSLAPSISRGWIFQETAFGPFCPESVKHLISTLCSKGRAARDDVKLLCDELFPLCDRLGDLLERRGLSSLKVKGVEFIKSTPTSQDFFGYAASINKLLTSGDASTAEKLGAAFKAGACSGGMSRWHLLEAAIRNYDAAFEVVERNLTGTTYDGCDSVPAFFKRFGTSLIKAYFESELSVESDRPAAITAVGRAILKRRFNTDMTADEFLAEAWGASLHGNNNGSSWGFTVYLNPKVLGGPVLGLGPAALGGSKITGWSSSFRGVYKEADGSLVDPDFWLWERERVFDPATSTEGTFLFRPNAAFKKTCGLEQEQIRVEAYVFEPPASVIAKPGAIFALRMVDDVAEKSQWLALRPTNMTKRCSPVAEAFFPCAPKEKEPAKKKASAAA